MKYNGIIYPNTPFFRKYAGKMIVPAGADSGNTELLPSEIMEEMGMNSNPMLEATALLFFIVSPVETPAIVATVDGDPVINPVISLVLVDESMIEDFPEGDLRSYLTDRIGMYVGEIGTSTPDTLTEGTTHDVVITVSGVEIFNGELTVAEE